MIFNFKDIFKSGFLDNITTISFFDMFLVLFLSFAIGLFIFFIYKVCYAGIMYSASFGITLIALSMITSLLLLAVTSNIVLSLGMVGALSIVRFRTAIKEPSDIVFLFWSLSVGIVLSAGFIPLAVVGSIFIGVILIIFSNRKECDRPYILVLHCNDSDSEKEAYIFLQNNLKKISLKSKSVELGGIELNYEVRLKDTDTDFINALAGLQGITHTVLVSYNGDYMS